MDFGLAPLYHSFFSGKWCLVSSFSERNSGIGRDEDLGKDKGLVARPPCPKLAKFVCQRTEQLNENTFK
jgi:hypothetical protein